MKNLVQILNKKVVVSSIQVANDFDKEHKNVLESIRQILAAENSAVNFFKENSYLNRGKEYPQYFMDRDGFSLLVMSFTGEKALQWKLKYIKAFNRMEKEIIKKDNDKRIEQTNKILENYVSLQNQHQKLKEEFKDLRDHHYYLWDEKNKLQVFKDAIETRIVQKGEITFEEVQKVKGFINDNLQDE